jgi:hypothetical protein
MDRIFKLVQEYEYFIIVEEELFGTRHTEDRERDGRIRVKLILGKKFAADVNWQRIF